QKTAESLYGEFGDRVFEALQNEPARVRELLGDRRAGTLLEQWEADPRKPTGRAARSPRGRAAAKKPAAGKAAPEAKPATGSAGSRGGRGRKKKDSTPAS